MFRALGVIVLMTLTPFAPRAAAQEAEPRIALVVGNGGYAKVTPLDNPVPDAELVADVLGRVGFEVMLLTEADQAGLIRAISDFGRRLRAAGPDATGLFYYAGHGVQSFGTNYLLPVDVELTDAADLSLVGVQAEAVLRQMFSANNRTNIVILDACRDNPFEAVPDMNDNGLAEMKAPTGTFLSYSTAPGDVAVDGIGSNSPFTEALARHIPTPGIAIERLFRQVRIDVLDATAGMQTPWDTSSLTREFEFVSAPKLTAEQIRDKQLWDSVQLSRDPVQILLFLRANPDSFYAPEARALLSEVMSEEIQPAASPPAVAESAPAPAPAPVDPETAERDLIETARQSGTLEDYRAYLAAFPDGVYAELAEFEISLIEKNGQRTDPIADPIPEAPRVEDTAEADGAEMLPDTVLFDAPIGTGGPDYAGQSLAQLILGSPEFPPIEGLPDAAWKGQKCSGCHQWTQEALCTQAQTYLKETATRALAKSHPYGGFFKRSLRVWAEGGCR